MTAVSQQTGAWLSQITEQPAAEPWLQRLRETAFQRFSELGFPTTHDEEWRFTNVSAISRTGFRVGAADILAVAPETVEKLEADEAEAHLAQYAAFNQNPFVALNTAFLDYPVPVSVFRVP